MEESLLTQIYQAFNARDIDTVLATMHQDVVWPNGMEGGYVYGQEAVRAYWTRQWQQIDPRVEPVQIVRTADGCWAVEVHQVVRDLAGTLLADQMIQHIYQFADGLITHMEIRKPS